MGIIETDVPGESMVTNELARLLTAINRHTPDEGIFFTELPGLILARNPTPTEPIAFVVEPSLCIVAQGAKEVRLGEAVYRYDPAQALLLSIDLPVSVRVIEATPARPCLAVRVALDMSVVAELLADFPDTSHTDQSELALAVSPIEPEVLEAVARLISLLDAPQTIASLAPLVLREITYRLLAGTQGMRLRQIAAVGAPALKIADAIRWLRKHFVKPLRGESLARQARMSLSGFHQHFKTVTGLSPLQYQKRLRLQEARRLMIDEGLNAASAAFRVGYESPSQFSREYRRVFGTPPHQDVVARKVNSKILS
jgi:AraC-like DNA-binding protein